jgi:hypothetical protein
MADNTSVEGLQGQVLDAVRKSQEAVVNAIATWAETVKSIAPAVPAAPFSDKLPKPETLVAGAYDFAEQLLASQRKFAEEVLQATQAIRSE